MKREGNWILSNYVLSVNLRADIFVTGTENAATRKGVRPMVITISNLATARGKAFNA